MKKEKPANSLRASKKPGRDRSQTLESRVRQLEAGLAVVNNRVEEIEFDIDDIYSKLGSTDNGDVVTFGDLRKFIAMANKKPMAARRAEPETNDDVDKEDKGEGGEPEQEQA